MRGGQAPYGAICAYKRCVTTLNDAADEEMSQHSEQKTRKYAPTPDAGLLPRNVPQTPVLR